MSSRRDELACIGSDLFHCGFPSGSASAPSLLCYSSNCVCCSCKNLWIRLKGLRVHTTRWPLSCLRTQKEGGHWPAKASCKQTIERERGTHEPSGETR